MDTTALSFESLSQRLQQFVKVDRPVLFSGAGVGKRVGLPLWDDYLEQLAAVCEKYGDHDSAALMRRKIKLGQFLEAAAVYDICTDIPQGERWKELARPFQVAIPDTSMELLQPLLQIPFGAVVTTNYDRTQLDAYSRCHKKAPLPLELDDNTLRGGALQSAFYIARIHGRVEQPTSMVLGRESYLRLKQNAVYQDFLINLLSQRHCLFLGFSFLDPAIRHVLSVYNEKAGPVFNSLHLAVLPSDASSELREYLHRLNIATVFYPPDNGHECLWKAARRVAAGFAGDSLVAVREVIVSPAPDKYSALHRCFAFTYAQQRSSKDLRPLAEQARDGLVLSLMRSDDKNGQPEHALLQGVRDALNLSEDEAQQLLRNSLARLLSDQVAQKVGQTYIPVDDEPNALENHLGILVSGVENRLKVREGIARPDSLRALIHSVLERVFVMRAWDVAAHYAGGGAGFSQDLGVIVGQMASELAPAIQGGVIDAIQRCCMDLLTSPSDRESTPLAEIGRTAFALQLAFSSPRQVLLQRATLPQRVYLDASILLPSLVDGHPLRPVYRDAFVRLRNAASNAGISCELIVGKPFLNEVIAHKRIAVSLVAQEGLNHPSKLRRLVLLYGAENMNVFIGAFASHVAIAEKANDRKPTFSEFLRRFAPYSDEVGLESFLRRQGMKVINMDFRQKHNQEFVRNYNPLLDAYEHLDREALAKKERILVEHEALQLTQLDVDASEGLRSVFVSADRRLQRALLGSQALRQHAGEVIAPEGFVGLVDVMVGLKADKRALARLIWAAPRREPEIAIRDYLVRKGLQEMDSALTRAMPEVMGEVVAKAAKDATAHSIDFGSSNDLHDVARTTRFMDRLDDEFLATMKWWVEQEEKK